MNRNWRNVEEEDEPLSALDKLFMAYAEKHGVNALGDTSARQREYSQNSLLGITKFRHCSHLRLTLNFQCSFCGGLTRVMTHFFSDYTGFMASCIREECWNRYLVLKQLYDVQFDDCGFFCEVCGKCIGEDDNFRKDGYTCSRCGYDGSIVSTQPRLILEGPSSLSEAMSQFRLACSYIWDASNIFDDG